MSTDTRIQSLESQVRTLRRAVCIMAGMLVVGYFAAKFAGIIPAITAFATALMIFGYFYIAFSGG